MERARNRGSAVQLSSSVSLFTRRASSRENHRLRFRLIVTTIAILCGLARARGMAVPLLPPLLTRKLERFRHGNKNNFADSKTKVWSVQNSLLSGLSKMIFRKSIFEKASRWFSTTLFKRIITEFELQIPSRSSPIFSLSALFQESGAVQRRLLPSIRDTPRLSACWSDIIFLPGARPDNSEANEKA